jgi:hypothetical protein
LTASLSCHAQPRLSPSSVSTNEYRHNILRSHDLKIDRGDLCPLDRIRNTAPSKLSVSAAQLGAIPVKGNVQGQRVSIKHTNDA